MSEPKSYFEYALALSRNQHPLCICAGFRRNDSCPRHGTFGAPQEFTDPDAPKNDVGVWTENGGE